MNHVENGAQPRIQKHKLINEEKFNTMLKFDSFMLKNNNANFTLRKSKLHSHKLTKLQLVWKERFRKRS